MSMFTMLPEATAPDPDIRTLGRLFSMTQGLAMKSFQRGAIDSGVRLSIDLHEMRDELDSLSDEDVRSILEDVFDWSLAILDQAFKTATSQSG